MKNLINKWSVVSMAALAECEYVMHISCMQGSIMNHQFCILFSHLNFFFLISFFFSTITTTIAHHFFESTLNIIPFLSILYEKKLICSQQANQA
jgi:hypothetical protein